jgi:hypothetical protein
LTLKIKKPQKRLPKNQNRKSLTPTKWQQKKILRPKRLNIFFETFHFAKLPQNAAVFFIIFTMFDSCSTTNHQLEKSNYMNKKLFLIGFSVMLTAVVFAQQIVDTINIKMPYLGSNGGSYILNWKLNDTKDKIYIYSYGHTEGQLLAASSEDVKEEKERFNAKTWGGKLLAIIIKDNIYETTTVPLVAETAINLPNKKTTVRTDGFFTTRNIPKGKNVYFIPSGSSGMMNLDPEFTSGNILKYHYSDLKKRFQYAPTIPTPVTNLLTVEIRGEGLIVALKNIKPVLVRKEAEFVYSGTTGFYTKSETLPLLGFDSVLDMKENSFVEKSDNITNGALVAWFACKNGDYNYFYYNEKLKESVVTKYSFDNAREIKVKNKEIFTKDFNDYGFLSIFGYAKKQDKNKKQYEKNEFDIIITGLDGKEISRKTVIFGDGDSYKNILFPLQVFYDDGKLKILNENAKNIFKVKYELLTYDINTGTITSEWANSDGELKKEVPKYYASDFLNGVNDYYTLGNKKVFIKNTTDYLKANDSNSPKVNAGFNVLIIDENYTALNFTKFTDVLKSKNGNEIISFQKILSNNNELVLLGSQGSSYYLTKVNGNGKISIERIKTPYEETAEPKLFFSYYGSDQSLIDENNRKLYLMNQYYRDKDNGVKVIEKIGITVVAF